MTALILADANAAIPAAPASEGANLPAVAPAGFTPGIVPKGATERTAPYKVGNFNKGTTNMAVSVQWRSRPADQRFLSLDSLMASVKARAEGAKEYIVDVRSIEIIPPHVLQDKSDMDHLAIGLPNGDIIAPTNWAFGQLCRAAGVPASYISACPSPLAAENLNYWLRLGNQEASTVKTYQSATQLHALTSESYGRIFDREVVEAVQMVAGNGIGDTRWKVPGALDWSTGLYDPMHPIGPETTTLFASDRDVFMFLVDDRNPISVGKLADGSDDLMFRGFIVYNSEVGKSKFGIMQFYLRAVCCNRILWGVENFTEMSVRHSAGAPARFMDDFRPALLSYAEGSQAKLLSAVMAAKTTKLADDNEGMVDFLVARKFSKAQASDIIEMVQNEEGTFCRTAWDVSQGITAFARSIPNTDNRLDMEMVARRILDAVKP